MQTDLASWGSLPGVAVWIMSGYCGLSDYKHTCSRYPLVAYQWATGATVHPPHRVPLKLAEISASVGMWMSCNGETTLSMYIYKHTNSLYIYISYLWKLHDIALYTCLNIFRFTIHDSNFEILCIYLHRFCSSHQTLSSSDQSSKGPILRSAWPEKELKLIIAQLAAPRKMPPSRRLETTEVSRASCDEAISKHLVFGHTHTKKYRSQHKHKSTP